MTAGGWVVMILSVSSVLALFGWCVSKVATTPDETERLHGVDFHPPDGERDA